MGVAEILEQMGDDETAFLLMPKPKIKTAASDALVGLWTIGLIAFVIAALYLTRELLIPLALAALFTLFKPAMTWEIFDSPTLCFSPFAADVGLYRLRGRVSVPC